MKRVKIADLRNHLSRYLDHVRAGGSLLVLDRHRPIAEIRPVAPPRRRGKGEEEARLAELERKGILRRGDGPVPPELIEEIKKWPPLAPGARLLDALLEEREESS
jgi:antitoxin (DNA-binding transcriptional repressor) of toxin-antitoxin stability system